MYCKDCKHWERDKEAEEDKRFGVCNHSKMVDDSDRNYWSNAIESSNDSVLFSDYEGYRASLKTGENFGCIHFESR